MLFCEQILWLQAALKTWQQRWSAVSIFVAQTKVLIYTGKG